MPDLWQNVTVFQVLVNRRRSGTIGSQSGTGHLEILLGVVDRSCILLRLRLSGCDDVKLLLSTASLTTTITICCPLSINKKLNPLTPTLIWAHVERAIEIKRNLGLFVDSQTAEARIRAEYLVYVLSTVEREIRWNKRKPLRWVGFKGLLLELEETVTERTTGEERFRSLRISMTLRGFSYVTVFEFLLTRLTWASELFLLNLFHGLAQICGGWFTWVRIRFCVWIGTWFNFVWLFNFFKFRLRFLLRLNVVFEPDFLLRFLF